MISFRRQGTREPSLDSLAEIAAEMGHVCEQQRAVLAEHEAIKTAMDRLYQEQQLLRARLERIDGRLERAEIAALIADPGRLASQDHLPPDVLALFRQVLEAGLPKEGAS